MADLESVGGGNDKNFKRKTSKIRMCCKQQRWSPRGRPWPRGRPRGHILRSLALALASKPQVLGLGLGLEALGPRKLPCPRLEDSTIFERLKFC